MHRSRWRRANALFLCLFAPIWGRADEPKGGTRADLYGDPLPAGAVARMGTTRLRLPNTGLVTFAFSPDGKVLATGADNTLRLWRVCDGRLSTHIQKNYEGGTILFSADGKWLATVAEQAICRLDATTGKLLQRTPVEGGELAVSADGKLLAITWKDGAISLRNTADGKEVHHWSESKRPAILVHFTSDGKFLVAMTRDKKFYRWDLAKAQLNTTIELVVPTWQHLAISPDGKFLALTPTNGTSAQIWDIEAGVKKYALSGDGVAGRLGLAFSPDGKKLASDWRDAKKGESGIAVWDADNGQSIRRIPMALADQLSLRFAPDNQTLATFSGGAAVQLWDASTGKQLLDFPAHAGVVSTLSFTPDGKKLVSAGDRMAIGDSIRVWETSTGRQVRELQSHRLGFNRAVFLPNGRQVLTGGSDGMLLLQDIDKAGEIRRFPVAKEALVSALRVSFDGKTAASFSLSGGELIQVWDLAAGKPLINHANRLMSGGPVEFSADGTLLVRHPTPRQTPRFNRPGQRLPQPPKEEQAGQIVIQDVATGKPALTLTQPDTSLQGEAFTSDNQVLATATFKEIPGPIESRPGPGSIHLWELMTGRECRTIPISVTSQSLQAPMAVGPNQRILAAASQSPTNTGGFEYTIQFWDVSTGNEILRRQGFETEARYLMFSLDGKLLASGHADGSILIWEVPSPNSKLEKKDPVSAQQLEGWWAELTNEDARKAGSAIWGLVDAGQAAVDLLRQKVPPATRTPVEQIKRLIVDLNSKDFNRREEAGRQLADLEEAAQPALLETLSGKPSAEQRRRIKPLLEPSLLVHLPEKRRQLRSVQVLERIGSPEAQKVLLTLAQGGPEARLTIAAKAALQRLDRLTPLSGGR